MKDNKKSKVRLQQYKWKGLGVRNAAKIDLTEFDNLIRLGEMRSQR